MLVQTNANTMRCNFLCAEYGDAKNGVCINKTEREDCVEEAQYKLCVNVDGAGMIDVDAAYKNIPSEECKHPYCVSNDGGICEYKDSVQCKREALKVLCIEV